MSPSSQRLDRCLRGLAWGAWIELGVPAWGRSHGHWYVDPEALLLLTATVGREDARLWDESLKWAAGSWPLLSRARLRRLLKTWPETRAWPEYAGRLAAATGRDWPGVDGRDDVPPAGHTEPVLHHPAGLALRLRAFLGVGARSEILRILLLRRPDEALSAPDLARDAGYTSRNLAQALQWLTRCGILDAERGGRTARYRLRFRAELETIAAPLPAIRRSFLALTRAMVRLAYALEGLANASPGVRSAELRDVVATVEADLRSAGLDFPRPEPGVDAWAVYWTWTHRVLEAASAGHDPALVQVPP